MDVVLCLVEMKPSLTALPLLACLASAAHRIKKGQLDMGQSCIVRVTFSIFGSVRFQLQEVARSTGTQAEGCAGVHEASRGKKKKKCCRL